MKVAVIIKRGHGAQDEGTHRMEEASTLDALRSVLGKPGSYISCVAFALGDDHEFPSPAAQAGATREAPAATADTLTCLSGLAAGETLSSKEDAA